MDSFQVKIGWKRPRKSENKNCRSVPFCSVPTRRALENSKEIGKKFKNLKNTTLASFLANIGWKMPKKRKNKYYRSFPFLHYA